MLGKHLCWLVAAAVMTSPSSSAEEEVVVTASAARPAIERILSADNFDVDRMSMREVADAMDQIPRGGAPLDFWLAYREHARAWRDFADARDRSRRASHIDMNAQSDSAAIFGARQMIETTFDRVEDIARRYGARLPNAATRSGR
jgi:hypothetical protein